MEDSAICEGFANLRQSNENDALYGIAFLMPIWNNS